MSFDDTEKSTEGASPRELYQFYQGSQSWAFTGADAAVTYAGVVHAKETIGRTEADFSQEEAAGSIQISLPAANPMVQPYVGFQPTPPLYVTVRRVHRDHTAATVFQGRVTQVVFDGPQATLSCVPSAGDFARRVPALSYQTQCNHALYGPGCEVDRELFKTTAVLDIVAGFTVQAAVFAAKPDGWFTHGYVELATGERTGDRRYVMAHAGAVLTLSSPFAAAVDGDTVHAYAGCDRTEATCSGKFNNLDQHLGFSRIPLLNPHLGRMF